ncbi:MAG: hypothetical protein J7603_11900 [Pseudacidovorax sp.]|nr:hypothetical protein [Pseudacidovorax sp.]
MRKRRGPFRVGLAAKLAWMLQGKTRLSIVGQSNKILPAFLPAADPSFRSS